MDRETLAEYRGLMLYVKKCEREQALNERKIKSKTKITDVYDSRSILTHVPYIREVRDKKHLAYRRCSSAFRWPLSPKTLKVKPKEHYGIAVDSQLRDCIDATVSQQASYHYPGYLDTLKLKAEDDIVQQTVKKTVDMLELLFSLLMPRSQPNAKQGPLIHRTKDRKNSRKSPYPTTCLFNWQDMLMSAQTAGWPSAVVERATARLTSYYRPSE